MKRIAPFLLGLSLACGGSDGPTAPAPVASVAIASPVTTLNVGETATLTATPKDAQGNALTGRVVSWTSSSATVATVSTAGLVTALTAGATVITATSETKSSQAPITVTVAGPNCTGVTPVAMSVGEVRVLNATERSLLCVPGGAAGTEYTLIPVNLGTGARTSISVEAISANTVSPTGGPNAQLMPAAGTQGFSGPAFAFGSMPSNRMPRNVGFERSLRARSRFELNALRASARLTRLTRLATPGVSALPRPSRSNIIGLAATPALGTLVTLNASSTSSCTTALPRTARVAAVTSSALVLVDTTAPSGGFSDGEYVSIAATFDTLVYAVDTTAFGAPYDMDANGRVILFFTTAVNQLTAAGATSVIGGFFWDRDLIPRTPNAIVPFACATSNEGEMFYLPVVDVDSRYNGYFKSKANLFADINGTTVHEFQHLINASRRIYITPEIVENEESWLNEGMSHLAEELLFYKVSGLTTQQDLGFSTTTQPAARYAAMVAYQADNLGRYNSYLLATDRHSAYGTDADADDLETRGATWALLRFALDRSPGSPNTYLRALVNAPTQGIPNFNNIFSGIGGLAGAVRDFTIANFTDNSGLNVATKYTHASWNYRDWLPHFTSNASKFPLVPRNLIGGIAQPYSLIRGGSAYLRFRVGANTTGGVKVTTSGAALSTLVDLILVRTQ